MDYDATTLPAEYDRARGHSPEVLDLWMDTVARYAGRETLSRILDLGCGTGRFADALASRFGATVIGVDPSRKMLEQARSKPVEGRVRYLRASGEAVPLRDGAADLIFMSMVFHHFIDRRRVGDECARIAPLVFLRAATVERIAAYAYVPFIPASVPILYERLNRTADIVATFEAAGFETVAAEVIVQQIASTYTAYADKLAEGGDSVLASVDKDELQEGLAAIRRHAARVDPQPVTEAIDAFVFRRW